MSKTIVTRIKNKVDSLSVWQNSVVNQVESSTRLLNGEIALVRVPTGQSYTNPVTGKTEPVIELLMKVGDGTSTFDQLPWLSAKAADVYDWAKASTVVVDDAGSNLVFKNAGGTAVYSVSLDKFALKGTVSALDSRVTAIEGALGVDDGGQNSVSARLATIEGAITVINGEDTVEGSIKKAEKDVKDYAKNLIDNLSYDASGSAAKALEDANDYTDGKVSDAVGTLNAKDAELNTAIEANATAIGNEVTARENAVNTINAKLDVEKVSTAIATAKSEAIADAKTETEKQVNALTEKVNKNTSDISTLSGTVSSEIARVEGLVTAEKNRAEGIESGLRTDVDKIKTFFAVTEGETLDTALDTLVEIQEYLNGEGEATGGMIGRVAALETGVENLEGRMDTAEDDIDGLLADLESTNSSIDEVEERLDIIEADYLKAEDKYDDTDLQTRVKAIEDDYLTEADKYDDTALKGRMDTAEDDIDAIEAELAGHTHSDYENQNAFSNIKVGDATIAADTITDTVEFVGSNVTITPDATNDKITFTVADGSTDVKGIVQLSDSISSDVSTTAATSKAVKLAYDKATSAESGLTSHVHGNIANDGTIASAAVTTATGVLVYDGSNKIQRATAANARSIIGAAESGHTHDTRYVRFDTASQGLSDTQKSNAITNIGAASSNHTHSAHEARTTELESNYVRVDKVDNKDTLVWANNGSVDEIIFDCGGAPIA